MISSDLFSNRKKKTSRAGMCPGSLRISLLLKNSKYSQISYVSTTVGATYAQIESFWGRVTSVKMLISKTSTRVSIRT